MLQNVDKAEIKLKMKKDNVAGQHRDFIRSDRNALMFASLCFRCHSTSL